MNENISRFLLALEALVFLLPLTLLYMLLSIILLSRGMHTASSAEASFPVATLCAGAGLFALWRLLATGVLRGIAALRTVHGGWMLLCKLIAGWVAIAWLGMVLTPLLTELPIPRTGFDGAVLGLYGIPALVPLLHLNAELRWRARDV